MTTTPQTIRAYLADIGRKGGAASGPRKARTSAQARAAALAMWAKRRKTADDTRRVRREDAEHI